MQKKRKLRILTVSISYPPYTSGVAVVAFSLTKAMKERGHSVGIITSSHTKKYYVQEVGGIKEYRLESIENPFRENYFVPTVQIRMGKIFREFEPDIIHLHDISPTALSLLNIAKNKVPVLYTHHFIPRFIGRHFIGEGESYIRKLITKGIEGTLTKYITNFANKCDYITTPTKTIKNHLREYGVTTAIRPISNGIDSSKFVPKDFNKKENLPILLYFGRIDRDKSLEVLVKAAVHIKVPFRLILAGSGQETPKLKSLAEKLGVGEKIEFLGFIEEAKKSELFRKASVFVIPSTVEAQSIVTMEALSTGLPVVAANASALPELVHDGVNGLLFKPENSRDMASKISRLLSSEKLQKEFGDNSLGLIKKHDIRKTFDAYEKLYFELSERYPL